MKRKRSRNPNHKNAKVVTIKRTKKSLKKETKKRRKQRHPQRKGKERRWQMIMKEVTKRSRSRYGRYRRPPQAWMQRRSTRKKQIDMQSYAKWVVVSSKMTNVAGIHAKPGRTWWTSTRWRTQTVNPSQQCELSTRCVISTKMIQITATASDTAISLDVVNLYQAPDWLATLPCRHRWIL